MAKLLYTIKMVLLQEKMQSERPPGSVFEASAGSKAKRKTRKCKVKESTLLEKVIKFYKFVVAVYNISWWITCGSATDAANMIYFYLSFYHHTRKSMKGLAKLLLVRLNIISGTSLKKCFRCVFSVHTWKMIWKAILQKQSWPLPNQTILSEGWAQDTR